MEDLADNVKEYVNTRIESIKLNAAEKSSVIIANGVARIVVAIVFLFFALASIALSLVLGEWLGKIWAGFLVVAGFYLFLGIIIWFGRGKFIRVPVMNALIQQLFKHDEEIQ